METNEVFAKRQEEINALQSAIAAKDKRLTALKPAVQEYNEEMRERKDLRKKLATCQREAKIVASWLQGTTLIDSRFPLFASVNESETHNESSNT